MKILLTTLLLLSTCLHAQIATDKQVKQWRQQMRDALFIPNPLPAPAPETYGSFTPTPGVIAERVSYATEFGLRVSAIVYRPATTPIGKMPGMVLVNGHGGDKSSWYSYYTGIVYARAGAVVVTYDPIGSGESSDERKPGDGEHDRPIPNPPSMPARMGGLMVTDIMQAVSYLSERKDVDSKRIAVLGFSMGSFETLLAGAADPRIHALMITGGGDLDGPGGYWDSSLMMCQSGPYKALNFIGDRPTVLYTLNARRGPTFILNGTNDAVVDIPHHEQDFFDALRQRVIAVNGSSTSVFETSFDPGASHRPNWMTPVPAAWLNQQLHFPDWQADKVAKLPTEPMHTWAETVGYPLGKSSGRPDRDGGLQVIIADVPLLTQDQLNIFNAEDWQKHKQDFVYSTWVTRALAAATH